MIRFSTFIKDLTVIRGAVFISFIVFAAAIAAGWMASGPLEKMVLSQIEGLSEVSQQLNQSENRELSFFLFIFFNNSIKSIIVIFTGLLFGILPLIFLFINGMVIGFLLNVVQSNGGGAALSEVVFKGLLPHGIIEIPVIIIACAYGLALGGLAFKSLKPGEHRKSGFKEQWSEMWRKIRTASVWIVILLFLAAAIESTITLWLLS